MSELAILAIDIESTLIFELYRRSFVVPRYKPKGWWECDIFEITGSGVWREYEIKVSRSDFKADAKKVKRDVFAKAETLLTSKSDAKHERLTARDKTGPNHFSFVVPEGLVAESDLPDWAGLIYARPRVGHRRPFSCTLNVVRKAPKLHKQGPPPTVREHAESVCYYRMNNLYMRQQLDFTPSADATYTEIE